METFQRKSKATLSTFIFLVLTLLVVNFVMVAPYLLAVLMGGILALISRPFYGWLRNRKWGPKLAAFTVTSGVVILVVGPVAGFSVAAIDQAVDVGQEISKKEISLESVVSWATRWKPLRTVIGDAPEVEKQLKTALQKGGTYLSTTLLGLFSSIPELGLQIVLAVLACFFVLIDGGRFYQWLRDRIPLDTDVRERVFSSFRDTAISSLLATVAAAGVQSAILFAAFLILAVPGAFLAVGATFIFAWIPIVGSTPVWLGGMIYLYTQGQIAPMFVMLAFGVVTSIADNVVRPLVLGGRDDMHPLVSLVSIFGGIAMFGLFGVFIGPILTALLLSLLQIWPAVGKRFGLLDSPTDIIQ